MRDTVQAVSAEYGFPTDLLLSAERTTGLVEARHDLFRRLRQNSRLSLREMARRLGFDHSTISKALRGGDPRRRRMSEISLHKGVARDFIDSRAGIRHLFNGEHVSLGSADAIRRLCKLRSHELQRIPHERRREPNARRVPAEQRIDDIDAAILAARYVRRFGDGH
ncbi:helix-turn-helix domain-containing protein [Chelatococcus sp.]